MSAVSTWSFGKTAVKDAQFSILEGKSSINATVAAIASFEDDARTGCYLVGRRGFPNKVGILQCDAALMNGKDLSFGAVAALEKIASPIRVADCVRKHSPHNMLVGPGAQQFAVEQGFTLQNNDDLIGEQGIAQYKEFLRDNVKLHENKSHDTLGLITMDLEGNITAGVSTSGMKWKYPGRVGDSPLCGCGLYADNEIGAACATGDGDEILKFCPSHMVVMEMANGKSPSAACEMAVKRMYDRYNREGREMFEIGLIAMNKKGECGSATTVKQWTDELTGQIYTGFPSAVWTQGTDQVQVTVVKPPNIT